MTTMRAQGHIPVRRQRKDGTSISILSTEVKYATTSSYSVPSTISESLWKDTYPSTLPEGTWLHTRTSVRYSDSTITVTYSSTRIGQNGSSGSNTATVFLYKRSSTPITSIDWSDTLTYTFSSQSLNTVPSGWSLNEIPSGTDPIYVTAATAYGSGTTDTITSSEWATPVLFVENGAHGLNTAPVFLYKRGSSAPAKPSVSLTYTFATGVLSGSGSNPLSGWSQTIPATDGNPCWVIQATAVGTGDTDTIASSEWSEQRKLVEDGARGYNSATVTLYRRSSTALSDSDRPNGTLKYTFATGLLSGSYFNGWSQAIPANNGLPLYVTKATAYSNTDTDTIAKTEWATPVELVEDGAHGLNSAPVFLYQRGSSAPAKPSVSLTYTFATGVLSGSGSNPLSGWSQTIPATDGNPCWVIQATAVGTGDTDTIASSEWSEQSRMVEDGEAGKDSIYGTIDNVSGSITCDETGYTVGEQYVDTNVGIEKGGVAQTIKSNGGVACRIETYSIGTEYASESSPTPAQNYKVRILGLGTTSANVRVYVKGGTSLSSIKISIDVKCTIDGSDVSRTVNITISGNAKGQKADPTYEIRSTSDSITVAADNTAATLNATVDFYKKEVGSNPTAFECHWALYRRLGNSYSRISYSSSKVATKQFADISTTVNGTLYDAFVVFINSSSFSAGSLASAAPTTYLAKKEILIKKNGNTGGTGPGGEVYSIMSTMGSITVDSNTNTASLTATISFFKKVGSAAKTAYSCHCSVFRKKGSNYYYIAKLGSKATNWYFDGYTVNAGTHDALVFCIYDSATTAHSDYLAELEIPVYKHGDTGPTYYPCGIYDNEQTYTKSGTRTPLVFVDDPNMATWNEYAQAYGEYWYLVKDTNVVNNVHYAPSDENDYWARAENYGVVMVGAQFARFAKNGAGVMAGDYYYSANGRINGVERVDGEGADGNAVSASNPPAYTRFMGDPTIQNGYFNRTNIQGPIANDKAQLATIYVLRGVTLNVRITGTTYYDGTNTKYGYFNIYKGSTAMCSAVWIYRLRRTVTLTFTAAQSGEYTIVYYGQEASTKASFMANWELTGHFYPNWWVNLKEGKMHGAKDKFILDGDGDIKVDGALMSHKVKLVTTPSHYVTYPEHAAYESNYWSTEGMVKMYEAESNGYPVRIYEGESPAVYYGLRNCRLLFDQVYIGCALGGTKKVWVFLPPPHLFVGQRIEITNMASNIPSDHSWSGVFVTLDYMDYSRTDYSEGICLTGQEAYFEDDGEGEHDDDGENGMPYICNVPERGGAGPIHAAGIWTGETIQSSGASVFTSNLENELDISDYEWIELTAVEGPFWKYKDTQYWEDTIKYNAYWMLTKWKKREEE